MYVHMGTYGGLWVSLSDSDNHSPSSILRQIFLLMPELPISVSVASQLVPEIPYLYLLQAGWAPWSLGFKWILGIRSLTLTLHIKCCSN